MLQGSVWRLPTGINNSVNPLFLENSKMGKKIQIKPQTLGAMKNLKLNFEQPLKEPFVSTPWLE